MDPDVFFKVTGGQLLDQSQIGILRYHETYFWPHEQYPYLEKKLSSKVEGLIINVREQSVLDRLNFFEDDEYFLQKIEVECKDQLVSVMCYFPTKKLPRQHHKKKWSLSKWEKYKDSYMKMVLKYFNNRD
jgi:hypothetical protein